MGRVPGDLAINKDGALWIVVSVDKDGRITKVTGMVEDISKPKNLEFDVKQLRYVWRTEKGARKWVVPRGSVVYRGDISRAMTYLIRLWGETKSPAGRELATGAALLAEVLDQAGIILPELKKKRWWDDWYLADVEEFCNRHGEGTQPYKQNLPLMIGAVVRLKKPDRLGVVTRIDKQGQPLNLLVNGGDGLGLIGEAEDAAKMLHVVDLSKIVWAWHQNDRLRRAG